MLDRHPVKEHGRQWDGSCNKHTRYKMKPDKQKLPALCNGKENHQTKQKKNRLVGPRPSSDGTPGDTRVRLWEAGLVSPRINVDSRW